MFLNLPSLDSYALASLLTAHPAVAVPASSSRQTPPAGASGLSVKPEAEEVAGDEGPGEESGSAGAGPLVEFKSKPSNDRSVACDC